MERMTKPGKEGWIIPQELLLPAAEGYTGAAADRLAEYEGLREELMARQQVLMKEIDRLCLDGKQRHYRTKELMAERLANGGVLSYLDRKGL